jgi:hypothetical protein
MRTGETVYDTQERAEVPRPVFVKFSPLLDPIRYMVGRYAPDDVRLRRLPQLNDSPDECDVKILECMNSAYTDNLFCHLSSLLQEEYGFPHSVLYYGSFLCMQDRFRINVEDELDYLSQSRFFRDGLGSKMFVDHYGAELAELHNFGSRRNKQRLCIAAGEDVALDADLDLSDCEGAGESLLEVESKTGPVIISPDVDEVDLALDDLEVCEPSTIRGGSERSFSDGASDGSVENDDSEGASEEDEEGDEESEEDADNYEDEDESEVSSEGTHTQPHEDTHAYIANFPVQMICMERCAGTLDALLDKGAISDDECVSALFQVIMTLVAYQRVFDFTHNDLHTNNIVYSETDRTHLEYVVDGVLWRVPTYGRIFKIIDFGRSIFTVRGRVFCSDSFAEGGDANGQYNCEPFFNPHKRRIDPNPSFDLCRLGCSMIDFFDEERSANDTRRRLVELVQAWCADDKGQNILYKRGGEERYPGFKMYKMVARLKHNAVPHTQLELPIFAEFRQNAESKAGGDALDIDAMPRVCAEPPEPSTDPYE